MTTTAAIKKISEDNAKKQAVIAVLKTLNGESYSDAAEILDLAKHFLAENSMLDFELARDILNQINVQD